MNTSSKKSLAIGLSIVLSIVIALVEMFNTTPSTAYGQNRIVPTPTPTRRVLPPLMPVSSIASLGDPALPNLCERMIDDNQDENYWAVSSNVVVLNDPHTIDALMSNTLWVQSCGATAGSDTTFWLQGENSKVLLAPFGDSSGEKQVKWHFYTFPVGSSEGTYVLEIRNSQKSFSREIFVTDYLETSFTGVHFRISDSKSGKILNLIAPGQSVQIDYKGESEAEVQVGLYQTGPAGSDMFQLVDSWQFELDKKGAHSQLLPISSDLPIPINPRDVRYILVADYVDRHSTDGFIFDGNPSFIRSSEPLYYQTLHVGLKDNQLLKDYLYEGEEATYLFQGYAGSTIQVKISADLNSMFVPVVELYDNLNNLLETTSTIDSSNTLLTHLLSIDGTYRLVVRNHLKISGSRQHFELSFKVK